MWHRAVTSNYGQISDRQKETVQPGSCTVLFETRGFYGDEGRAFTMVPAKMTEYTPSDRRPVSRKKGGKHVIARRTSPKFHG